MKGIDKALRDHWVGTIVAGIIAGFAVQTFASFLIGDLTSRILYNNENINASGSQTWKMYVIQIISFVFLLWVAQWVFSRRSSK